MLFKLLALVSFISIAFGFQTILDENPCPKGSVQGVGNPNECYKLILDAKDWYSADGVCQELNGHLVSIHDAFSNTFFGGMVGGAGYNEFWIGANNNNLNGTWKWIDGSSFNYDDWAPGNPQPSTAYCMSARVPSGFWYSTDCRSEKPFVCNVPPAHSLKPSCLPGWNYFDETKSCYKVVEGLTLTKDGSNAYTAIGLISDGYTWKWRDGTAVDYSYWYSNGLRNESCAVQISSLTQSYIGQWTSWYHNQMSSSFNKAVCKISAYANA
uniref:C-type lectin domain-containing protein n=1 Tax=Panagrolaimus davidi TaxID=227884 RepID=A0A914Q450_9BILA